MNDLTFTRSRTGLGYPQTAKLVRRAVDTTLKAEGIEAPCAVEILLTDDETIREINREHRDVDRATDVLSFPMNELEEGRFDPEACEYDFETDKLLLGDMVLDLERCAKQGEEFGHGYDRELSYLTVHSVLHLLGYDHLDEGPRKRRMRAREKAIMALLGGAQEGET